MKYILNGSGDFSNPIKTIFDNRGITQELFEVNESVMEDYDNYNNMQKGIELLIEHMNKNSIITLVVDCDPDGFTSSAILYRYIKEVFKYENIYFTVHSKKKHGLSDDIEIKENTKLIILPDASSNDYEQHKEYKEKGVDILVLDHHICDHESEHAVVINNQLSDKVYNKRLSGAGITYKYLKALDDTVFRDSADKYLDLVAIGNIADVMNLNEKETRFLCYLGMENVKNTFLKALIDDNTYELEGKYNIKSIGWVIAPKLNGLIRSGSYEDKVDMFKAFISDDYNFCLEMAKKCKSSKTSQDSAVKKAISKIEPDINFSSDDRCVIVEVSDTLNQSHTGLVANKFQDKYGVPVLLYRKNEEEFLGGSGRGNPNITNNFRDDLLQSKLLEFAEGHGNSFGWQINRDNLNKLKTYINELYKDREVISGKTYQVDFILEDENINSELVSKIAEYEDEWGNGLDEPLIAFENVMIGIGNNNIKGTKSKTMVFEVNGVKFVKKFLSNDLKDKVLDKGLIFVTIVGKCTNNIYNGTKTPQIEVIDMQIE